MYRRPLSARFPLLAALALASVSGGCDLAGSDDPLFVTTERISFDFRVSQLVPGVATTVQSTAPVTVTGRIPGGFRAGQVAEAYVESVSIAQVVPSGAVATLTSLQNVTFSLNGQNVATNASLAGTTGALASLGVNAGGVFTSDNLRGGLTFTPTRVLNEEYAVRVSFVARVVIRGF